MAKIGYMEGALEQAVPGSVCGSSCARRTVQLGEYAVDVAVNGVPAQNEPGRDLLVAQALRHQAEDFHFSRGQAGQVGSLSGSLASLGLYFTEQCGCGLGIRDRSQVLEDSTRLAGVRFGDLGLEFT